MRIVSKRRSGGSVNNSPSSCHTSPSASDSSDHVAAQKSRKEPDHKRKRVQSSTISSTFAELKIKIPKKSTPDVYQKVSSDVTEPVLTQLDDPKLDRFQKKESEISEESKTVTLDEVDKKENAEIEKRESRRGRYKCKFCSFHGTKEGIVRHIQGKNSNWKISSLTLYCSIGTHHEKYIKWRQERSDVLLIGCKECDWFFASLDELESHLRSIHPLKGSALSEKKIKMVGTKVRQRHVLVRIYFEPI